MQIAIASIHIYMRTVNSMLSLGEVHYGNICGNTWQNMRQCDAWKADMGAAPAR